MTNAIVKSQDMSLEMLGQVMVKSGFFQDTKDAAQAIVKILAGQELGFGPIASMQGVYIVKGKTSLSANLVGAAIKRSGRYDYRVIKLDDTACVLAFYEGGKEVGKSEFSTKDAQTAGLAGGDNWRKFPRNMLFSRALTNGARWYCPDVFNGPIYTPDELGAVVDGETYEVVETPAEPLQLMPAQSALIDYSSLDTHILEVKSNEGVFYTELSTEDLVHRLSEMTKQVEKNHLTEEVKAKYADKIAAASAILKLRAATTTARA